MWEDEFRPRCEKAHILVAQQWNLNALPPSFGNLFSTERIKLGQKNNEFPQLQSSSGFCSSLNLSFRKQKYIFFAIAHSPPRRVGLITFASFNKKTYCQQIASISCLQIWPDSAWSQSCALSVLCMPVLWFACLSTRLCGHHPSILLQAGPWTAQDVLIPFCFLHLSHSTPFQGTALLAWVV